MSDAKTKTYPNGRYCVFQPFDKGDFDNRYDDTIAPAIEAAGMEPYRVDRDPSAVILMDTLHKEIRGAAICVADITTRNPNVMYELGYALAAGKDVVIISGPSTEKFPFDVQHRGIIAYSTGSVSDFKELEQKLTEKLKATLERREKTAEAVATSPVKESGGLKPHEVTALALLLANCDSTSDVISSGTFKSQMQRAGYTEVGARIAFAKLTQLGYATDEIRHEFDGERWVAYGITEKGQAWLIANQSELELGGPKRPKLSDEIDDSDIPF